jgi:uncharacterized repeat protein (TIGR01451 family)
MLAPAVPGAASPTSPTDTSNLTIEKYLLEGGPLLVGGSYSALFSIQVHNSGVSDATAVVMNDALDSGLIQESLQPAVAGKAVCAGSTCTIATLAAGETVELLQRVQVDPSAAIGTYYTKACLGVTPAAPLGPAGVVYSSGPGIAAPPATLGSYSMTAFPADGRPTGNYSPLITSVPGPTGDLLLSLGATHYKSGTGPAYWNMWGHGYTGDVYAIHPPNPLVLTLPPNTGAFYLYLSPNISGTPYNFTVVTDGGVSSGAVPVASPSGARYFGFYSNAGSPLQTLTITMSPFTLFGYGVGEFAIADYQNCAASEIDVTAQADVWVEVSGPAGAAPDAAWVYTVTAHNDGPSAAANVHASATLPAGLSTAGALSWTLPSLEPGASHSWTVSATLDSAACPGGPFLVHAAVQSDMFDPVLSNNTDDWITALKPATTLTLSKASSPGPAVAGSTVNFNLTVSNTGLGCAWDVLAMEDLGFAGNPTGLVVERYSSTSTQATNVPADGVWYTCSTAGDCRRAAPLPPGISDTLALTVRLPASTPAGAYQNRASLTWTGASLAATATAGYNVTTQADLAVSVMDLSDPVQPGQGLVYQITAVNHGPSDAAGVVVTDQLDAALAFAAASPGCVYQAAGHQVLCTLGTLPAGGTATLLVAGTVGSLPGGTLLNNQAAVADQAASPAFDPLGDNNLAAAGTTVQQEAVLGADLSISKTTAVTSATAGNAVTYQMVVSNAGPLNASGIEVQDLLPDGTRLVSISANNPDFLAEYCHQGGGCYLGRLVVGHQARITVTLQLDEALAAGTLVNQAVVTAIQVDDVPGDNLAAAGIEVIPLPRVDLALVKRATATVPAGGPIDYTLEVWNHGDGLVNGAMVSDALPADVSFVSASPACSYAAGTHSLACSLEPLAAGASAVLTVTTQLHNDVAVGASVENNATVSVPGAIDLQPADNRDSADTSVVELVDLALSLSGPVSANAGDEVVFTLLVTNTGPSTARSVTIRDLLPAGLQLLEATVQLEDLPAQTCEGAVCLVGDMDAGQVAQVTVKALVDANLPEQVYLSNQAVVFCHSVESTLANNTGSSDLLVLRQRHYLYMPLIINIPLPPPWQKGN